MSSASRHFSFPGISLLVPAGAMVFALTAPLAPGLGAPFLKSITYAAVDTLRGTPQDDVLRGTAGNDQLEGNAGEDRLIGGEGDDVLRAGEGRDLLDGGPGSDVLEGGDGDDWLDGGDGKDWLFGERGEDRLQGGAGPDVLDGGPGADQLDGGADDDLLDGHEGDDVICGGLGKDILDGGDGLDLLDGGEGNDNLDGGDENDILRGLAGADSLSGGDGDDDLDGGPGDDFLTGDDGADLLKGGPGNDALAGRDGTDNLDGGEGNDLLNGGEGDDFLQGGAGADTLLGSPGKDQLRGGLGNDVLRGDEDDDVLDADAGDDRLSGGRGTDVVRGGDGNDVIFLRAGDVDSARIEIIEGGANRDTARVEADTLLLNGISAGNVRRLESAELPGFEIVDPLTRGRYFVTGVEHLVYLQVVPYLAGGAESVLQLVNGSAAELSGRLEFVGSDGKAMPTSVGSDSARPVLALALPPQGSRDLIIRPPSNGTIRLYSNRPIGAMVRTAIPEGQAGEGMVAAGPVLDMFTVPAAIDRRRGTTSGFAVSNGAVPTTLLVWLYTARGAELEGLEIEVAANAQIVRFAHDLFPGSDRVEGKLVVQGGPMTGVGLQVRDGSTNVAPALAIAPRAGPGPTWLSHVVNGNAQTTTITLLGLPPDTAKGGRIAFFDDGGKPLALDVVGVGPVTEVPFTVPQGGSFTMATTGSGALAQGSARITTTKGAVAASARLTGSGGSVVEVPATRGHRGFAAPVRRDASQGVTTLVTLSAGSAAATVDLTLHEPGGRPVRGGTRQIMLPANGRISLPLERLFPAAAPGQFRGSLMASVTRGMIGATLIELGRQAALPVVIVLTQ